MATTALVAVTAPACADPVSLVTAGITALLSATTGTIYGAGSVFFGLTLTQISGAIVTAGLVAANYAFSALAGKGNQGLDPGQAKTTFETGNSGRIRAVGRVRIGGLKVYGNTTGTDRYRLIAHCAGPIDGVEEHFLGGRSVVVEADGSVSSPPFAKPVGSYVTIKSKVGDGTETSWTELQTAFPTLWTSEHRARGIAQSLIKYVSPGISTQKFLKLYQSGAPEYERVQRSELIYDPRTGAIAWSDNGVLVVLHILLTFPDFSLADFDLDFIKTEADRADVLIDTRTGTEKRSRAWGIWDEDGIDRGDLLKQVLMSTGCEMIARPNEKIGIRLIDDTRPAEIEIAQKHVVSLALKAGPEGVERPNKVRVKYYSPERNYSLADLDLVYDGTLPAPTALSWSEVPDEIARVGEKIMDITLPFCPSAAQAQRIARRMFAMARGDTGTLTTNMVGLACWGAKTITVTPPDIDGPLTLEISPASVNDTEGTVTIPFVVQPSLSEWNPATDEALPPLTIPDLEFETALSTPVAATENTVITYPSGGGTYTRFGFADIGSGMTVEANYRVVTAGVPGAWQSMTEYRAPNGRSHAYVSGSLAGQSVEFRHRYFNSADDGSKWSTTYAATVVANNAGPSAPSLTVTGGTSGIAIDYAAPNSLNVAYLVTSGGLLGSSTIPVKPGDAFTAGLPGPIGAGTYTATVTPYASDGTAGTPVTASITI